MGSDKHLVIAAAGTGGHVMPGLAVAAEMIARGWEVSWLGTEAGMEKMLVSKKGIEFDAVDFSGVRGHGLAGAVSGAVKRFLPRKRFCRSAARRRSFRPAAISLCRPRLRLTAWGSRRW